MGRAGGTHVTTKDLSDPDVLPPFASDVIPGSTPKQVTEIEVPDGAIRPDPTKGNHPDTGWIPPNTPGARSLREWEVDWGDFMSPPKIKPIPPGSGG